MKLTPGMVGGHCIGIDPYYLMHKSEMSGYTPNIMRAARKLNDEMYLWVVEDFLKYMKLNKVDLDTTTITILGYSFKDNCSDSRNTKVRNLIYAMKKQNIQVDLWDPLILDEDHNFLNSIGVKTYKNKPNDIKVACVCVYHDQILQFLKNYKGILYDYKNSTRVV